MRRGDANRRGRRRHGMIELLASARPAQLNADLARRAAWPDASQFISVAELADCQGHGAVRPDQMEHRSFASQRRLRLVPPGGRKLLAAGAAAVGTGIVIWIALVVGASVPTPPHSHPGPTAASHAASVRGINGRVVFRDLRLGGSWHGRLEYGVNDGVVYLAGSAGDAGDYRISMATLPPGIRPARQLDLTVGLGGHGTATVQVTPDGRISVFARGTDYAFVSLDGVSFPLGS